MNKIAELRKAAHLTQEKFAAIIGVARSTIAMYEYLCIFSSSVN